MEIAIDRTEADQESGTRIDGSSQLVATPIERSSSIHCGSPIAVLCAHRSLEWMLDISSLAKAVYCNRGSGSRRCGNHSGIRSSSWTTSR